MENLENLTAAPIGVMTDQVAKLLGVHPQTIWNRRKAGQILATGTSAHRYEIPLAEVSGLLEEQEGDA